MMEDKVGFRLYLSSDSSKNYHPKNTKSSFGVHLANRIVLEGRWEVAVTELITAPIDNVNDSPLFIYCNISAKVGISDTMSRCLRILPPLSSTKTNSFVFDNPYFEEVESKDFQDVSFKLLDRNGTQYNLRSSGTFSYIVLYFRQK